MAYGMSRGATRIAPGRIQRLLHNRRRWRWHGLDFGGRFRVRRAGEAEATVLAIICALDMFTTLWWVVMGKAIEANGLLAWTFHHHPLMFVGVKCLSCLPALYLAPRLGERHPLLTKWLLRVIIVLYVGWYALNIG